MPGSPSPCAQNVDCGVSWQCDTEQIAMLQVGGIEGFFQREVLPYVPDAWFDDGRTKIGCEIRF